MAAARLAGVLGRRAPANADVANEDEAGPGPDARGQTAMRTGRVPDGVVAQAPGRQGPVSETAARRGRPCPRRGTTAGVATVTGRPAPATGTDHVPANVVGGAQAVAAGVDDGAALPGQGVGLRETAADAFGLLRGEGKPAPQAPEKVVPRPAGGAAETAPDDPQVVAALAGGDGPVAKVTAQVGAGGPGETAGRGGRVALGPKAAEGRPFHTPGTGLVSGRPPPVGVALRGPARLGKRREGPRLREGRRLAFAGRGLHDVYVAARPARQVANGQTPPDRARVAGVAPVPRPRQPGRPYAPRVRVGLAAGVDPDAPPVGRPVAGLAVGRRDDATPASRVAPSGPFLGPGPVAGGRPAVPPVDGTVVATSSGTARRDGLPPARPTPPAGLARVREATSLTVNLKQESTI